MVTRRNVSTMSETNSIYSRAARKVVRAIRPEPQVVKSGWPLPHTTVGVLDQLFYQQRLVALLKDVPGDIVECGVGTGRSLNFWCALAEQEGAGRHIWGFDSFEGFPEPTAEDLGTGRSTRKGEWNNTSLEGAVDFLHRCGWSAAWVVSRVTLVKGFFDVSLTNYRGDGIALLHADADLYQSYLDIFGHLYDKVVPGGIIAFDEYMGTRDYAKWPGAKQAIDEFFGPKNIPIIRDAMTSKYYAIKPRVA